MIRRSDADTVHQYYQFLTVGIVGSAQTDVTQQVLEVEGREKTNTVKGVLNQIGHGSKTLIFVKTKKQADFLASLLSQDGDRRQKDGRGHPLQSLSSIDIGTTH